MWAHRFTLLGYVATSIGAWMLVYRPRRGAFMWLAIGATLQLIGGVLQHGR